MIKYGEAKEILAKYIGTGGRCSDDPRIDSFVLQVLQYLLLYGSYGGERVFSFCAQAGCITLPYELDVPLKVRIDGAVGTIWSKWWEYHSGNEIDNCCIAFEGMAENPNRYPTVYDVCPTGECIGVAATCEENCDAHVVVKGEDPTGRVIYTMHKGKQIIGEYVSACKGQINRTQVKFGKITEVSKTLTNGYVTLLAVDECGLSKRFLADYGPYETAPSYRRFRLLKPCPDIAKVTVLGRIRLKEKYADDDLIPFDNRYLLSVAGQTVNSMYNSDVQTAVARDGYVEKLIEKEADYKKTNNGQPVEIFRPLSGGAVRNARAAGRRYRR